MDQDTGGGRHPHDRYVGDLSSSAEAALACNCCRRRKLRCSREVPVCHSCRKSGSDCVYEAKRGKPGMKAGAIDNLHKRLDVLEKQVQQQQQQQQQQQSSDQACPWSASTSTQADRKESQDSIFRLLAQELQRYNGVQHHDPGSLGSAKQEVLAGRASKRPRREDWAAVDVESCLSQSNISDDDDLEPLLEAYFTHIHPWIPMVHEGRLRRRLLDKYDRSQLRHVLDAMLLVAARFIKDESIAMRLTRTAAEAERSRDGVVAAALKQLSVESQQALIMVAFNDIGSGIAAQAWSIVGALSRNVEYLQLATENDGTESSAIVQPFVSLALPQSWAESEERRRVFWTAFKLDRLCSVTMGWNTSLTSDDVNRRLPSDGIRWRKEEEVRTPYFGIWDKAAGRIGNSIAFLPSYYSQQTRTQPSTDDDPPIPPEAETSPGTIPSQIDMSTVGAFAYCIEATESLSRVTTYFLQQRVNMWDQRDVGRWLTRFKELDLRLVHWKMLLPRKWNVDVSQRSSRMDPNLTMAHVTHNASMILLHQPIAFPLAHWPFQKRLPSICSADTCQSAAIEIATIVDNYLKTAPRSVPVASQFGFCLYVAARACLLQWQQHNHLDESLIPQFWFLIESLDIMARLWAGPREVAGLNPAEQSATTSLAAKYSRSLKQLHQRCSEDSTFRIHPLCYTREIDQSGLAEASSGPSGSRQGEGVAGSSQGAGMIRPSQTSPGTREYDDIGPGDSCSAPFRTLPLEQLASDMTSDRQFRSSLQVGQDPGDAYPLAMQQPVQPRMTFSPLQAPLQPNASQHRPSLPGEDLGAVSRSLFDPQFVGMDRVISYDDGIFGSEFEAIPW